MLGWACGADEEGEEMRHATSIESEPCGLTPRIPRFRWLCSCGSFGPWKLMRGSVKSGATKHVTMIARGLGQGVAVEEHW